MRKLTRRQLVATVGSLGAVALTGCSADGDGATDPSGTDSESTDATGGTDSNDVSDGSSEGNGAETDGTANGDGSETAAASVEAGEAPDGAVADGTVAYPDFLKGDALVRDDDTVIEYGDPEETFGLVAAWEGDAASENRLRVDRELGDEVPTGFVAPVHDGDRFVYHAFVNGAFVDLTEWHFLVSDEEGAAADAPAEFADLGDGISHAAFRPDVDERRVLVADRDMEALESTDSGVTGMEIARGSGGGSETPDPAPQAVFSFDFDADAETVTITHNSGDTVPNEQLVVRVEGETIEAPFESDEVTAGSRATVDVAGASAGSDVLLVWQGEGSSSTLASASIP